MDVSTPARLKEDVTPPLFKHGPYRRRVWIETLDGSLEEVAKVIVFRPASNSIPCSEASTSLL